MLSSIPKSSDSLLQPIETINIIVPTLEWLIKRKMGITLHPALTQLMFLFSEEMFKYDLFIKQADVDERFCCQLHTLVIFERIRQAQQPLWMTLPTLEMHKKIYEAFICSMLISSKISSDMAVHNRDIFRHFSNIGLGLTEIEKLISDHYDNSRPELGQFQILMRAGRLNVDLITQMCKTLPQQIQDQVNLFIAIRSFNREQSIHRLFNLELYYLHVIDYKSLIICSPLEARKMILLAWHYSQLAPSARHKFQDKKVSSADFEQLQLQFEAKLAHFGQEQLTVDERKQLKDEQEAGIKSILAWMKKEAQKEPKESRPISRQPEIIPAAVAPKQAPKRRTKRVVVDPMVMFCKQFERLSLISHATYTDFKDGTLIPPEKPKTPVQRSISLAKDFRTKIKH